ncbi:MAG: aromatic ring hydroxylase [Thermoprotei archaeon]|nr:MAG: aromatic ring hydroxylase [Thermoprotei archaeon]
MVKVTRDDVINKLKEVYDPEIPIVNIVDLGLIYNVDVSEKGDVHIKMTMTTPMCPMAGFILKYVENEVKRIPGVRNVSVELVWDPPWTPERMSEKAKRLLGLK